MDLVQMLANAVQNVTAVGIRLVLALSLVGGIVGLMTHFGRFFGRARRGQMQEGPGKILTVVLLCGAVMSLHSVMTATSHQMGLGEVTFGAIAYVSEGQYGPAAVAVNAVLTLLQLVGVSFALGGLLRFVRASKDGHTALSAGDDVTTGAKKLIAGVMLACNPQLLDAVQNTLKIHW